MRKVIALAKKHKFTTLVVVLVLAYIVWLPAGFTFIRPYIDAHYIVGIMAYSYAPLKDLQCPLTPLQGNQVVATVENPYDEPHSYTFYFNLFPMDGQKHRANYLDACEQEIEVLPRQTADAACTIHPPSPETDFVTVSVWAESDVDREAQTWIYESSYIGKCTFPINMPRLLLNFVYLLLGSVASLASLAWATALWPTLDIYNRSLLVAIGLPFPFILLIWTCPAVPLIPSMKGLALIFPIALATYIVLAACVIFFTRLRNRRNKQPDSTPDTLTRPE